MQVVVMVIGLVTPRIVIQAENTGIYYEVLSDSDYFRQVIIHLEKESNG